jgi:DNA replication protein DnaC
LKYKLDPNPPAVRSLTTPETERLRQLYPDLQKSQRDCKTCQGKGTFRWYAPSSDEAVDWECSCVDQFYLHRWFLHAGIGLAYQRMSWRDAKGVSPRVIEKILEYTDSADRLIPAGIGLLMLGTPGTGKTMLSTLLLKDLVGQGYKGFFTTFHGLLDNFTDGWGGQEKKAWFDGRVRNAGVLVIDDMGREHKGRIDLAQSTLDYVLRARVSNARPTILTSNLTPEKISELYSTNALSLLSESAMQIDFVGEDYRPTQRTTIVDEARQGLARPIVVG